MKGDLLQDVKDRLTVEEVVADYVELKRAGRNMKGLSPFNPEKTPSFVVSPEKQIWHDFSSARGGSMFDFVMEMEGVGFREALELLARKAGLDVSEYRRGGSGGGEKHKKRLLEALSQAAKFYQAQLLHNRSALDYAIKKRGFNQDSIKNFVIGYSPRSGSATTEYLKGKGFTPKELQDSGISIERRGRQIDMFRGRVQIPLMDTQGQVIGFTARSIHPDDTGPKYINTPQTGVYDKSRHVYGFSQAKDAIRRAGFAVVTEGNLDVVTSHQVGVKNVVATAGTAMTLHHLKTIGRMSSDIRLSFDADRAGLAATERAIELAQQTDVQISVITIPEGKDPDELIREDLEAWNTAIASNEYALDWLYNRYKDLLDITSARGKKEFTDILLGTISGLKDEVEKDHYLRQLGRDTDTSYEAMLKKLQIHHSKPAKKRLKKPKVDTAQAPPKDERLIIEDNLLGLMVISPITRRVLQTADQRLSLTNETKQALYTFLLENPQSTIDDTDPPKELQEYKDYVKLISFSAEQQYVKFDSNKRLREANDLANKLIKTTKKHNREDLIQQLRQAEDNGNSELAADIMGKIDLLNKKPKQ